MNKLFNQYTELLESWGDIDSEKLNAEEDTINNKNTISELISLLYDIRIADWYVSDIFNDNELLWSNSSYDFDIKTVIRKHAVIDLIFSSCYVITHDATGNYNSFSFGYTNYAVALLAQTFSDGFRKYVGQSINYLKFNK